MDKTILSIGDTVKVADEVSLGDKPHVGKVVRLFDKNVHETTDGASAYFALLDLNDPPGTPGTICVVKYLTKIEPLECPPITAVTTLRTLFTETDKLLTTVKETQERLQAGLPGEPLILSDEFPIGENLKEGTVEAMLNQAYDQVILTLDDFMSICRINIFKIKSKLESDDSMCVCRQCLGEGLVLRHDFNRKVADKVTPSDYEPCSNCHGIGYVPRKEKGAK